MQYGRQLTKSDSYSCGIANTCEACGKDLSKVTVEATLKRQVFDLPSLQ